VLALYILVYFESKVTDNLEKVFSSWMLPGAMINKIYISIKLKRVDLNKRNVRI
jgi:hypothetical protein